MRNALTSSTQIVSLRRGQTRSLLLPVGAQLIQRGGAWTIELPPHALAGNPLRLTVALGAGQTLTLEQRGWTTLRAADDAEIAVVMPQPVAGPVGRALAQGMAALVQALRRVRASA